MSGDNINHIKLMETVQFIIESLFARINREYNMFMYFSMYFYDCPCQFYMNSIRVNRLPPRVGQLRITPGFIDFCNFFNKNINIKQIYNSVKCNNKCKKTCLKNVKVRQQIQNKYMYK